MFHNVVADCQRFVRECMAQCHTYIIYLYVLYVYIYIIHINQILMRVAVRFFVSPLSLCMALYPSIGQAPICF